MVLVWYNYSSRPNDVISVPINGEKTDQRGQSQYLINQYDILQFRNAKTRSIHYLS